MHIIEFYFDVSSPWTYLAFESIQAVAARGDVELIWKPVLVGGVFNAVNDSVYANRANPIPAKARYYAKDLRDWARHVGIRIGQPPVFPVNSVRVMRGAFVALDAGCLVPYARRAFERYWGELADISQEGEVRAIAESVGLDADAFWLTINEPAAKDRLKASTQELIDRGGFGSPTLFLDGDDMYFGNDRIPLLTAQLDR